jgi:hypothetical protein
LACQRHNGDSGRLAAGGRWGYGWEGSSRDGEPDLRQRATRNSPSVVVHSGVLGGRESSGDGVDGMSSMGFFGPEGISGR